MKPFFCQSCLGIQRSGRTERMDHWQENEGRRMILFLPYLTSSRGQHALMSRAECSAETMEAMGRPPRLGA
jgi:hypothetical protein